MSDFPPQSEEDEQQSRKVLDSIRRDLVELNNQIARRALDIFEEIQPFAKFKYDNSARPDVEAYGYYSLSSKWLVARPLEAKPGGDDMPRGHLLAKRLLLYYRFSERFISEQDREEVEFILRRSLSNSNNLSAPDEIRIETRPLGTGDHSLDWKYGGSELSVKTLSGGGIPLLREPISNYVHYAVRDQNFEMFSALQPRFLTEAMVDNHETGMLAFRDQLNAFAQLLQDEDLNPRTK